MPSFSATRRPSARQGAYWPDYGPVWGLLVFTVVAVAGYYGFALHPQNLARFPQAVSFYAISFPFFARAHVLLTAGILVYYLFRKAGRQWLGAFAAVYAASLLSEWIGTTYGFPFGPYSYTEMLGFKWFDRVPWLIPLGWFGMAVPSFVLARAAFPDAGSRWIRIALGALILTTWDLSLDPAMSYLTSYWVWGEAGSYYGMPLVNLAGWYATSLVLMELLERLGAGRWGAGLSVRWMGAYYGLTLLMPLGMILAAGLWGAVAATLGTVGAWAWLIRRRVSRSGGTASKAVPAREDEEQAGSGAAPQDGRPGSALPADLPADAWEYFSRHSRSFSFAALGFSPADRKRVSRVYAFCRMTDDMVDHASEESREATERRLDAWLARARAAYDGHASGIVWLDDVMAESARAGVPFRLITELVEGVRTDLGPVSLPSVDALNRYAYRVASVVGLWLCHLFGVKDTWTLERAASLGRAMQITNILRDVGEDLRFRRVYLPADLLRKHGLSYRDLEAMQATGTVTPAYRRLIDELMALADRDYEHAWEGIVMLPKSFGRVVAVAAEVYRGIHRDIRRRGYDNFRYRARTTLVEKGWLGLQASWRLLHLQCRRRAESRSLRLLETRAESAPERERVGFLSRLPAFLPLLVLGLLTTPTAAAQLMAAQAPDEAVERLRQFYLDASSQERYIDSAFVYLDGRPELGASSDPVVDGYRGALTVMKAKYVFWPGKKMAYLKEGLPVLDRLVEQHAENVEIRYLRLLSCYFLPGFLKRSWSVEEDTAVLARLLPGSRTAYPPALYQSMVSFVLQSEKLNGRQRVALEEALAASVGSDQRMEE